MTRSSTFLALIAALALAVGASTSIATAAPAGSDAGAQATAKKQGKGKACGKKKGKGKAKGPQLPKGIKLPDAENTLDMIDAPMVAITGSLILVDGNPLQNISDIRKVSRVVKDGKVYVPAEIYGELGVE